MKYKVFGILGESGCGKDSIVRVLTDATDKVHNVVGYTTRPMRQGEVNGVNYYFLTENEFNTKDLITSNKFNIWYYGIGYENLDKDKINICILNTKSYLDFVSNGNIDLITFYIKTDEKQRLLRQLNRESNPNVEEIIRRYKSDKEDFIELQEVFNAKFDYILPNNNWDDHNECVKVIWDKIK